ncbi:MAG: hypothetical protein FD176_159 [Rhodospirillaceae bacterium]|nr:MAG: hypothetical protein FD176_159 [Rhodospirillaceae bacterium]TNC98677.1 MAG: hypothetical protein FD119_148 [Stygiobacter sp.]
MAKQPITPTAFMAKRAEQQEERRTEAATQAPGDACAHLQVRLYYEDHELVRRVAKRDLQSSIQAFLVEAISARLQELGHAPIRDPGAGRRGGQE